MLVNTDTLLIGLTGTLGAGKGTVAEYFIQKEFHYTSCSDYLRKELKKRGVPENVDNLKQLGDTLRKQHGPGFIAQELLKSISGNTIVDSLRNPGEIETLRQHSNFILIAVDAPIEIRYERIKQRKRAGDNVSFETFQEQEKKQLTGNASETQLGVCITMADFLIINDASVNELSSRLDTIYKKISSTKTF